MRGEIRDISSGRDKDPSVPRVGTPRRLAAIVVGDICGYSRLMELDEEGTHARVRRIERDLIEPSITEHDGKLVKTTGDGFIAIFDSPVEAVRCGIVIQQSMIGRNAALPKSSWIEYRIGVNLGDVIIEPDDVFGDGVNIAARLEGIADPGQVYISGGIYEQIKHKLVCGYESLGDRKIKNITDPVRVYRVLPDPAAFNKARKRREHVLIISFCAILLAIAGAGVWYLRAYPRSEIGNQASAPAAPPQETGNASPRSAPAAKQARPEPAPAVTPVPPPAPPKPVIEPVMVPVPGGTFAMGSNDDISEKPIHQVTIKPFAISKYPVSVREWNACAAANACPFLVTGREDIPVTDVSWTDAKQFVAWLTKETQKAFRLPSEAEWEYAARGGTQTKYWWGDQLQPGMANCKNCADTAAAEQPLKLGSLKPNPFGLYDMGGGVNQWTEDCWHKNYQGAPQNGLPWVENDCVSHVIRSGSWKNDARYVRPASRDSYDTNVRYPTHGFRIAISS